MNELIAFLRCWFENFFFSGHGDESTSDGDTATLGLAWTLIATVEKPAIIAITNLDTVPANSIFIATQVNPKNGIGKQVMPGTSLVLDAFKGSVYARAAVAGSQVNWYKFSRW